MEASASDSSNFFHSSTYESWSGRRDYGQRRKEVQPQTRSHTVSFGKLQYTVCLRYMIKFCICNNQGCGLGLEVSVSRRSRDVPTSRLGLVSRQIVNVSLSSRSHLGLGHLRLVSKTNFRPNCAGHSMQCERAVDVVSLCCSYYCSSY